jgi:hypothetical protein
MVRRMATHAHNYCDMLINNDTLLEGSINNIKNAKDYEGIDEKKRNMRIDDISIEHCKKKVLSGTSKKGSVD